MTLTKTPKIIIIHITVHFKQDLLKKSLLSKSFSGDRVLSFKTKFASRFIFENYLNVSRQHFMKIIEYDAIGPLDGVG